MTNDFRSKTLSRRGLFRGTAASLAVAAVSSAHADAPGPKPGYEEGLDKARSTIANFSRITSPEGIQELYKVKLGGADQWISVRGRNRHNPILLYVHGGPGAPEMPLAWTFQAGWEDYFTVVQWDQRGSGKSYGAEPPEKIAKTLSAARIIADGGELLAHLSERYGAKKIAVLGQSWGSFIGLQIAAANPDRVSVYIGTGQIINFRESEKLGYDWVLARAIEDGNGIAVAELRAIAPYPNADGSLPISKLDVQRKWSVHYGALQYGRSTYDYYWDASRLSPDYDREDVVNIGQGSDLSLTPLIGDLINADLRHIRATPFPVVFLLGRRDWTTASTVAERWLHGLRAPAKRIVWFENSAHLVPVEEPGKFLVHLVQEVLPLASKATGKVARR